MSGFTLMASYPDTVSCALEEVTRPLGQRLRIGLLAGIALARIIPFAQVP